GGFARLTSRSAELKDLCFVPGVRLSGFFPVSKGHLLAGTIRVDGPQAAAGAVRVGLASHRVIGRLGGRRFDLSLAKVRLARAASAELWPDASPSLAGPGRA